eukprot:gene19950-38655_t
MVHQWASAGAEVTELQQRASKGYAQRRLEQARGEWRTHQLTALRDVRERRAGVAARRAELEARLRGLKGEERLDAWRAIL